MSLLSFNVSGLYPDGTSVKVYPEVITDSGHLVPAGEKITEGVVVEGVVNLDIPADGRMYTLAALLEGEWQVMRVTTSAPSDLSLEDVFSQLEDHIGLHTTAHGGIVASTDPRLTDARVPTPHHATHNTGGTDAIAPGDISAEAVANKDTDSTMAANSDVKYPSQKAVKTALALKENAANKGNANGYASLEAAGKVPVAQLPSAIMEYQGTWNANTNTPALADGAGNKGDVYRVSVAAERNLGSGVIDFQVGDYAIYNGATWEKSDTTDSVASVAGKKGVVTLAQADIEGLVAALEGKQKSLGYTAENEANKSTDSTFVSNSDTLYPSQKAVRTYQAAQAPMINVKDPTYGAKGDGVTDDYAAIAAAITAAKAVNGNVYLPSGTFISGTKIVLPSNVRLVGAGWVITSIKAKSGFSGALIEGENYATTGIKNGSIEHLLVDGNKANTEAVVGIKMACKNMYFNKVLVRNCDSDGFSIKMVEGEPEEAGLDNYMTSCRAINCEGRGFNIEAHDTTLYDCQAIQCKEAGFYWTTNGYMINCHSWCYDSTLESATETGYRLSGSVHCIGCIAEGATTRQVLFTGNVASWIGGEIFNGASKPNAALFEINGGTSIRIFDPWCHEFGTGGAFKFTTNGEGSTICARCFDSGGNQVTQGTPSDNIDWDIGVGGSTGLGEAPYFKRRQLTFQSFTPGTVFNKSLYFDNGTGRLRFKDANGTTRDFQMAASEEVASANTISVSSRGSFYKITGSTEVKKINGTFAGHKVVLQFSSTAKLVNGENLALIGNLEGGAGRIITLIYDGTNWCEESRTPAPATTPTALATKAEATEFEPSATRNAIITGRFESATATRTKIKIEVGGVIVVEEEISVAATGVSVAGFCFVVPAGKKWKWTKIEGTVEANSFKISEVFL